MAYVTVPTGQQCSIDWETGIINCSAQTTRPRVVDTTRISTNPNTGQVQVSSNVGIQKWIDAALSGLALIRGADYVPTTTQPKDSFNQGNYPAQNNLSPEQIAALGSGASFGAGIESFVKNNFTLIAIGAGVFVLYKSGRK